MTIAGYNKNSFVDYPGKIAAVVFMQGCNFNCGYCHNQELIGEVPQQTVDEKEVLDFLISRREFIDGAVLSGGEPTLVEGLAGFAAKIKNMGFLVKLDTNGTRPQVITELLNRGLLDFIAMDIKAPFEKYSAVTCTDNNLITEIKKSIEIIKTSGIDYEFRTTFIPKLTTADILEICRYLAPCRSFVLQQYRPAPEQSGIPPHPPEYILRAAGQARAIIGEVGVRGV